MPADFDKQSYWHQRFSKEAAFEWLLPSARFMEIMEPHLAKLSPSARILQIGFGTSDLQNHFRARGFLNITNVDYEPLAVERGHELERQAFGDIKMRYAVQDATQLNLHERFDLIIDKSTVDAVSCGGETQVLRMAEGIKRCLANDDDNDAVWISLSYSSSRFEVENLPFEVEVMAQVPTPKLHPNDPDVYHWCYLLRPKR